MARGRRTDAGRLAGIGRHSVAGALECVPGGRPRTPRIRRGRMDSGAGEMSKLSHYDDAGSARMVDVSEKNETRRTAKAHAFVRVGQAALERLPQNPKGNPLEVARIA